MQCLASNWAGIFQLMCICVSQEGEKLSSCLWSITHPCIVGRKVASFCAFLWAIVIPQLNSFEFIQPSWILSIYFYIRGERQPRREREEEEPCHFCRVYNGIYTEAWNPSYKYFRTLVSAEINLGNTPRGSKGDLFSALLRLPLAGCISGGFCPQAGGGLSMEQSPARCHSWVLPTAALLAGQAVLGYRAQGPSLGLGPSQ